MSNDDKDLICMAQCKLTMQQSNLLDEMARRNNTTRSYELRMILTLYGKQRLNIDDETHKELMDAEKAGMSLYELYKEIYPDRSCIPILHSIPWYTGIHFTLLNFIGLLELEMINKSTRELLFKYTNRFYTPIQARYPEIALIMVKVLDMTRKDIVRLEVFNIHEEV